MTRSRAIHLVAYPDGLPTVSDFALVEEELQPPRPGEMLVANEYFSLDPAQRIRMRPDTEGYMPRFELGTALGGWAVGRVIASENPEFAVGDRALHNYGWRDVALVADDGWLPARRVEVDAETPARLYVGALGFTGLASYIGLFEVARPRAGDVVFVSGGAGAVGGLAIQLAKLRGHRVIASAGTAAKVEFCRRQLGADAAFCYREGSVLERLRECAPEGIDVYFDNVGGDHLEAALEVLNPDGRVALCGSISTYNEVAGSGPGNLFEAIAKGLTLRGYRSSAYDERWDSFVAQMRGWLRSGEVIYPETTVEGLEQAPAGFISMLSGGNVGKTVVRV
jgi:NADPH-dependent curcumin reductase CurA